MSLVTPSQLERVLRAQNPWWTSGALPQRARYAPERVHDRLLADTERPTLLAGPRRSGKSTALFRLLANAGRPQDVAYLPLDHPVLRLAPLGPLVDEAVRLMGAAGRPLVLLDGLQALPQWPERFLELVKTRPHPRLVAAASVAPGGPEPEYDTVHVPPLGFVEFCELKGVPELGAPALDFLDPKLPAEGDPKGDFLFNRVLEPILADYLVRGGFADAAGEPDLRQAHAALREQVVARAVYQDLPAVVGVATVADLERVLLGILLRGGEPLHVEAFADAAELDPQTVGRYLGHLARAFLLTSLKNFAASTDRSRARHFPSDPGLANALLERGVGVLGEEEGRLGLLRATVVAHVQRAVQARGFDAAYFKEGDLEADVVVVSPEGAVPVVVVDRDDVGEEEAAQVAKVMKKCQAKTAFLLSRAGPRRREPVTFFETINHLPAAYFLYALR